MTDIIKLEEKTLLYRKKIMEVGYRTQSGHLSSALSCIDVLTALYDGEILNFDPKNPNAEDRDRFILSKGHACIAQYIVLAERGLIDDRELYQFCRPSGRLGAHPNSANIDGIDVTTGSLGHGVAWGIGIALAAKYLGKKTHTYVVIGDGECQEGSIWEGALCASQHKLDNLTIIVDYNKLQAFGWVRDISDIAPLAEKWNAFGFEVDEVDGHDMTQIVMALKKKTINKPHVIIAHTVKGKGVKMMENRTDWHGRKPNDQEWEIIRDELEIE